ncbi:MAG: ABC transporter ATP-binding protein/permease [Candidatus Micrarchaeota archaeon]|nr:ABC transporter ATP-binding protein/permease [Candidatus Micrarchaeota archaeon]
MHIIIINLIEGIVTLISAWLIIESYLNGGITIGQLTFYWSLLFQVIGSSGLILESVYEINHKSKYITQILRLMNFKPIIKEPKQKKEFPNPIKKGIEFRNVTFYYPGSKKPVLKDFNLKINANENIAIVGENGAGKTTLIKLLLRMYDVSKGEILIDGISIKQFSRDEIYKNIGIIFQDFGMYEASVEENIWYGNIEEKIRIEKIHESAQKAGAWEFIKSLPKRYKTHLGKTLKKGGTELSRGQWQKIALAKAFYKDAQILCLDEPTASIDAKSEYKLFRRFKELAKNKTTILISHRFSTVKMADRIIVIDKGKIIESGSHKELMKRNGRYAKLYNLQAAAFR